MIWLCIQVPQKQAKPKQNLQRALVQIVPIARESAPPSNDNPLTLSALPAISSVTTTTTTPLVLPIDSPPLLVSEPLPLPPVQDSRPGLNNHLQMLPTYQRRIASPPQASPLRSRHNTVTGGDLFRSRHNNPPSGGGGGEMLRQQQNLIISGASSSRHEQQQQQQPGGIRKEEASSILGTTTSPAAKHEKENIYSTIKDS